MIKCKNINGLKHAKEILDTLKSANNFLDTIQEGSVEYEMMTERIGEQLCEIDEFFTGMEKIMENNLVKADIRMMTYWDYIKNKITFDDLLRLLKRYSAGEEGFHS